MKITSIVSAFIAFTSLVSAIPLEKRDLVWVTDYVQIVETIAITQTIWVDATSPIEAATFSSASLAVASSNWAQTPASITDLPVSTMSPSSSVGIASSPSIPLEAPSSTAYTVLPVPATSALPTQPTTFSSIVSVSTPALPLSSTSSAATVIPTTAAAAPAAISTTGTVNSGDMTFYDVGLGSCGWTSAATDYIVALSTLYMKNGANPNNNPLCGKSITISYGGKQTQAKVVDTCQGCSYSSIDMSDSLFEYFADLSVGRAQDVSWWFT